MTAHAGGYVNKDDGNGWVLEEGTQPTPPEEPPAEVDEPKPKSTSSTSKKASA